ncbi:cysteine desulfurase family protein [Fictibacillus fluitans]|uniref:Cysteine desulfurase family protein n=1 Tax=Fictibacillus fluitans TaxID=3058422 RepID=A0ABT8I0P9_9BACL|nr:cysteine desulfurase family protein [Fictibacillus sp. NE201]MDN4526599.1 cysteine desulfurase family protein [Fictibacillus sp. NE201]
MIYFDNSATTRPYKEVLDSFVTVSQTYFANPSSIHSKGGETERLMFQARKTAAGLLGVKPNEIIFTSGGTEGNNTAIKGIALKHQERGKHLITSEVEHASSYETFHYLEFLGFEVTCLPVNAKGEISLEQLENSIREDTILVSLIHVNNEVGTIQPIVDAGKIIKRFPKVFFHVDHVQGIGKVPLNLKEAAIDLCTMSGHKFHGLKGTGILYKREGVSLSPLLTGGEQEINMRAGTENVAGIVSIAKALRMSLDRMDEGVEIMNTVKERIVDGLSEIRGISINTPADGAPHIINFSVDGVKPEVLIHTLDQKDIYVSTRSACSSKQAGPSRILMAMGLGQKRANTAIRISLSYENTMAEAEIVLKEIKNAVVQLQTVMG